MDKPKRKASVWIQALKEYNKDSGSWCLPKKGSAEYEKVKAISDRIKQSKNKQPENEKIVSSVIPEQVRTKPISFDVSNIPTLPIPEKPKPVSFDVSNIPTLPIPESKKKQEEDKDDLFYYYREANKKIQEQSTEDQRKKILNEVIPQAIKDVRAGKFTKKDYMGISSALSRKFTGFSKAKKEEVDEFVAKTLEKVLRNGEFPTKPNIDTGTWTEVINKLTPGYYKRKQEELKKDLASRKK
jgi:hypothetical protein